MESAASSNKYSFFQAPFLAFFSKDFYADVARNWKGAGLVYMLLLVALSWLVTSLDFGKPIMQMATNKDTPAVLEQLPTMTLAGGKMTIDKPYPYPINDPNTKASLAVFVKERKNGVADTDPTMVITESNVLCKGLDAPLMDFSQISTAPTMQFTGHQILQLLQQAVFWLPMGCFALGVIPVWLGHVILMLLYGGITMGIAAAVGPRFTFTTAMRLAAVAMGPTVLISTLFTALALFGVQMPAIAVWIWKVLSIAVVVGLLALGIIGVKESEQQQPAPPSPQA